jgi:hypothetical protein
MMAGARTRTIERVKWSAIGIGGKAVIDLLCRTIRTRVIGLDGVKEVVASRKFILAFWHSRIVLISYLFQGWGGAILVSPSDDGEIMARILQRQGHETIRGSSSRNGFRAMARLIKALKEETRPGVVVPDGPQGPRFRVQPGVLTLAQKTGYPIVPVSYSASRVKIFASWDRFMLPYPFGEATLIYGQPLYVPSVLEENRRERYRRQLEDELNDITGEADRHYGHVIT